MTSEALPDFYEPRRLHPLSMFYRGIVSAPAFVIAALAGIQSRDQIVFIILSIVYVFLALPSIVFRYYFFQFYISGKDFVIESGVFSRRVRSIPLERIQNIETHQNFLQRLLRIARVSIETAGGVETEGVLEFVSVRDAESIRHTIRRHKAASAESTSPVVREAPQVEAAAEQPDDAEVEGEAVPAAETEAQESDAPERVLLALSGRQVLIYGMMHFSLWFLGVSAYLLQITNMTPEDIAMRYFNEQVQSLSHAEGFVVGFYVVSGIVLAILLSWVSGILFAYNKYHGFRLTIENEKLHKQHGLFSVAKGTIPLKKLQMMVLTSNPIMRKFGYRGLQIQTAGFGGKQQRGPEVAVPLAGRDEAVDIARNIRPFDYPDRFEHVSRLTIRRAFIRYTIGLLVLAGPIAFFVPLAVWFALLLPLLYYAAVLRFRYRGYSVQGDILFVKHGFIWRRVAVIPIEKIQTLSVFESLFQRRLGLASLLVDTAGVSSANDAGIIDVAAEDAMRIQRELSEQFSRIQRRKRENAVAQNLAPSAPGETGSAGPAGGEGEEGDEPALPSADDKTI